MVAFGMKRRKACLRKTGTATFTVKPNPAILPHQWIEMGSIKTK
jgi:hypothetical protein